MPETMTVGGPILALCGCCVEHGPDGRPLLWEIVTCPECGSVCSCEGCVADVEVRRGL
jgi:hypothetical protein